MESAYRELYSEEQIARRIRELAVEIEPWARDAAERSGHQVLAVCVLNGALFFFADLLRALRVSMEPACCRASSYTIETNQQAAHGVKISVANVAAAGRAILIVDDICDTGATLAKLQSVFEELGAVEVRSAVVVRRKCASNSFMPSWTAFEYEGDEWFVGYGMDNRGFDRNLPGISLLDPATGE
ncbi:MAG: hypothetical protein KDD69_14975 [Bdellovibrionales bacterium]|nr:hypothetical protein [Bdellovibrionales bacterium]